MFNKLGNRSLLIIAAVLALLWIARWWSNRETKGNTLRAAVIELDTAQVRSFIIAPKSLRHAPLRFERDSAGWTIGDSAGTFNADDAMIGKLLAKFVALRTLRLAGDMAAHRDKFELSDTACSRITFHPGSARSTTLSLGKVEMTYSQEGETFVNLSGEEAVFAVPGALTREVDKPRNAWRDHVLIGGNPADWQSVELTLGGLHGYTLAKRGGTWELDGKAVNQERVAQYLRSLSEGGSSRYADGAQVDGLDPVFKLTIRDNRPEPLVTEVFDTGDRLVLRTNRNPGTLFQLDRERDMSRLMRPAQYLMDLNPPAP